MDDHEVSIMKSRSKVAEHFSEGLRCVGVVKQDRHIQLDSLIDLFRPHPESGAHGSSDGA